MSRLLAVALELVGIATVGGGIGIELSMKADVGFVLITGGSCLIAIGGVLWGKFVRGTRR